LKKVLDFGLGLCYKLHQDDKAVGLDEIEEAVTCSIVEQWA
jgi:hypothetical protein